ncbi:MAG: hypothetical protein WCI21_07900 [Alphaproteobacteria bacterium]
MAVREARYEALGQAVANLMPPKAGRALLYAEFEEGMISPALFYELNGDVHYVFVDDDLTAELIRLQEVFGPEVKAVTFELELREEDADFRARFTYADKFDAASNFEARTDAAMLKYFGHTSAHNPPFEGTPYSSPAKGS